MSQPERDPFARRPHLDEVRARVEIMPLSRLSAAVLQAAEVVMGMPEEDDRRPYARQYLERVLEGIDAVREQSGEDGLTQLAGPFLHARWSMHAEYGTADSTTFDDPLHRDRLLALDPDPEVVRRATAGMQAADAVLTNEILGPPEQQQ